MKYYIGIDVGGSSIKAALVDEKGNISHNWKAKTPTSLERFYLLIDNIVNIATDKQQIEGIAMSLPGAVDSNTGIIGGSSALPYIHGPNIKKDLETRTNLRVEMENDANCAALAEVWIGNASDVEDSMFVVSGTGIGGAVIKDKKIHRGVHLHGGEYGYEIMIFDEVNKKFSTWSDVGSTIALVNRVAKRKNVYPSSLDGAEIFDHVAEDNIYFEEVDRFYYYMAMGIYNLQYTYDPEVIVIGGGVSARDDLVDQINQRLDVIFKEIPIAHIRPIVRTCKYHNDANIIGAVYHFATK